MENSPLLEAGAMKGDMIFKYDGKEVYSLEHLAILKEALAGKIAEVVLIRDMQEITVKTPKGALGVYLREFTADHEIKEDAVIIPDIGNLGWGIGMENSFLGCLFRLEENRGSDLSYADLTGLSAYGFRTHFFPGYCPSSPDATVGKDVGSLLMERLGYQVRYIYLDEAVEMAGEYLEMSRENMLSEIINSIDRGFPVLAIDILEVPEWGLITGYQAGGKELFCRSYFDKTMGYELVQKFPWVILVIDTKKEVDINEEYDNSLGLAYEMYTTEAYEKYFSGLRALEEWIAILRRSTFYYELPEERKEEVFHANWWILYSLYEAKFNALKYLQENTVNFHRYSDIVDDLTEIYAQEVEILADYVKIMPNPYLGISFEEWTTKHRLEQVKILHSLLKLEEQVVELLE